MVGHGQDDSCGACEEVIICDATTHDASTFETFALADSGSRWMDEVTEILAGLLRWRDDPAQRALDRQAVVLEVDGRVVAVAAHERVEHERVGFFDAVVDDHESGEWIGPPCVGESVEGETDEYRDGEQAIDVRDATLGSRNRVVQRGATRASLLRA